MKKTIKALLLLCVLLVAGCSGVMMSPSYEFKLREAVAMAEVRDADCQAGNDAECRSNSLYTTKKLRLFLDAFEGKVSE